MSSTSGTQKILNKVGEKIKETTGIDVVEGMDAQQKPYNSIYRGHYKFGCYRCTRLHERGPCPPLPEKDDSDNSSDDDSNISSGDITLYSSINNSNAVGRHDISDGESEDDAEHDADARAAVGAADAEADVNANEGPAASSPRSGRSTSSASEGTGGKLIDPVVLIKNDSRNRSSSASKRERETEETIENGIDKKKRTNNANKNKNDHASRAPGPKSRTN